MASTGSDCPVETMYWEFPASVYGGYTGCVSQVGVHPCAQDGFDGIAGALDLNKPIYYDEASGACMNSGYTPETMSYWILWGSPMDASELIKRTGGEMPVISFPFDRAPYPSYYGGAHGDDSLSAHAKQKEFLEYINAFTATQLAEFDVATTEGAESGMIIMWGAKALEIARTTCVRDVFFLMEVPAYGYSPSTSARWANSKSSSFFDDASCPCYTSGPDGTSTCTDPTVTITAVGWAPGSPLPERTGFDGLSYVANSASPNSPWVESLVFPENPSGTVKTVQLPNADRRVCDGVYLYPIYFGGNNWEVPPIPDCASWSFSITKSYSASVRAGNILFKNSETSKAAHYDIIDDQHTMANGLMSEWTWRGQVMLYDMYMEKPYTDPTSWVGAYKTIIEDKWNFVIDGFKDCPVVELLNDYQGAYAWFKKTPEYTGLESSFLTSLFAQTLGVKATTYNWGFRGADPADMYGEGYGVNDFTRMHLYRDISVYEEVGRRAKIMCAGGQVADHLMTYTQWAAAARLAMDSRRHLLAVPGDDTTFAETRDDTRRRLSTVVPDMAAHHIEAHVDDIHESAKIDALIKKHCASDDYSMSCMMKYSGGRNADAKDKRIL